MFEHLDDDAPFVADGAFRAKVEGRGLRMRARRRLAAAGFAMVVVVVAVASGAAAWVRARDNAIDRVDVAVAPVGEGEPINVLVYGSDRRDDPEIPGERADTIILVRLDAATDSLAVLSVPRDLVTPSGARISQSLAGGPQSLIDGVTAALGVPIHHFVGLEFDGFRKLVDEVGGLPVRVESPLHDEGTGVDLEPGCRTLDGETALALARSRRLSATDSDLGRINRQEVLVGVALSRLRAIGTDPVSLDRLARVLGDHAVLDSGLDLTRLMALGMDLRALDPDRVLFHTLPVGAFESPDGAAMLALERTEAASVLREFGGALPPPVDGVPSTPSVVSPAPPLIAPC